MWPNAKTDVLSLARMLWGFRSRPTSRALGRNADWVRCRSIPSNPCPQAEAAYMEPRSRFLSGSIYAAPTENVKSLRVKIHDICGI